jgi:serine protease AprX
VKYSKILVTACFAVLAQPLSSATDPLKVFLQGGPANELRVLVENNGGQVTHDLHLINAVGATLTPDQLKRVVESPLVERHFDDLSVAQDVEDPPAEPEGECSIGGAVELDFTDQGFSWRLYNQQGKPARLEQLEISWPRQLGQIEAISLGGEGLDPQLHRQSTPGSLKINLGESGASRAPILAEIGELKVRFGGPPNNSATSPLRQRDLELKLRFAGNCRIELIPGYEDNHENFHYAAVAGADALHQHGITGKGITVAVIDSGLWDHPALTSNTEGRNRILARYNAIDDTLNNGVFDESGHGTHMSSIIAHSGRVTRNGTPTGSFQGISPDVNLVSVKAFNVEGQGEFLDIVRAVQWVVDNRDTYNIRVLNLSFAAWPRWPYWLDPINQAVMRAWDSGITVVAAAGNEGPHPMTIGSPGNLPYIITVGAVTDSWTPETRDDDYIPDFSSRGPTPNAHIKPDIVAPGGHITGLIRPGSGLTRKHPGYMLRTGEFVMSGSSQASAVVAGMVALLLQLEPELSPDDVKCMLMTSAEPAINRDGLLAYSPFAQGHGYANVTRAVTLGQRGCGNADMPIRADLEGGEHFQGPAIVDSEGSPSLPGLDLMVSPEPTEKGASKSRKWGVKAHIERGGPLLIDPGQKNSSRFDWQELYRQEKSAIENLARERSE